jgi:hypothetical protein
MMNYSTSVSAYPQLALGPLLKPPPGIDADVYRSAASMAELDLSRQAQIARAEAVNARRSAQNASAMQGAGLMATAAQRDRDVANQRQDTALRFVNSALRGLYT